MNIKIITVGTLKEQYLRSACEEYIKRISGFSTVEITELPEARLPSDPSDAEIAAALESEGTAIIAAIPQRAHTYAMCVEGKMLSSPAFSENIGNAMQRSSCLCFIIGGSCGLSPKVKALCRERLSFSPLTFPHQLMRVILLEQVYRSFMIINNRKYHK